MRSSTPVLVLLALTFCANSETRAQADIAEQFERRSHTFETTTLPYRLFVPVGYDSTKSYPIVLTLHGSGERGTNNVFHIERHRIATSWADSVNQASYPTFVVSPQAPQGGTWSTAGCYGCVDTTPIVGELATVMDMLDSLETEFNIDANRIYVTGLSMGGFGTWELIARFPERFAAAIPMSGGGDPSKVSEMASVPIWNFHGLSDGVVPAAASRQMIEALFETGRSVVYTDCDFSTCGTIDSLEFQNAMDRHADLIYTEYLGGGHVIWDESYDDPRLFPWVFSQYKQDEEAIVATNMSGYRRLSGEHTLQWSAENPTDSVEIWITMQAGEVRQRVSEFIPNTGTYTWDTSLFPDTPLAQIHLFVKNQEGFVYGKHTTSPFIISNGGPSAPYVLIDDNMLDTGEPITDETIDLVFVATDVESALLSADVFYSIDGGQTLTLIDEFFLAADPRTQSRPVDVSKLPNSRTAVLRLEISDGDSIGVFATTSFVKQSSRVESDSEFEHVEGSGVVAITEHIVDPGERTGHRYRITFDDTVGDDKRYSVTDLDESVLVLDSIPFSDGVRESPEFDGLRLVVFESAFGNINLEETGWTVGDSDLGVAVSSGTVNLGGTNVVLAANEDDYELTITDSVVDTSITRYLLPEREMRFTVVAASDTLERDILFKDTPADGIPSPTDAIVILDDVDGSDQPAWLLTFSGDASTILPEAGDVFRIVTQKGVTAADVFEFVGGQLVSVEEETTLTGSELGQNYPNPFDDSTVIPFRIDRSGDVTVRIFDLLGREVVALVSASYTPGEHQVEWRGVDGSGRSVSAGLYFVRLDVRGTDNSVASTAVTSITRIRR